MGVQCKRTLIRPTVDQNSGDPVSCHSQILKAVKATSTVCLKVTWLPHVQALNNEGRKIVVIAIVNRIWWVYLRSICVCKGTISHKSGCTLLY